MINLESVEGGFVVRADEPVTVSCQNGVTFVYAGVLEATDQEAEPIGAYDESMPHNTSWNVGSAVDYEQWTLDGDSDIYLTKNGVESIALDQPVCVDDLITLIERKEAVSERGREFADAFDDDEDDEPEPLADIIQRIFGDVIESITEVVEKQVSKHV